MFEFKLPDIGEGVTEGEIVEWLVAAGDTVAEDDPMVEVMTDKATVTIGAPTAGTIANIHFGVGDVAQVGQVIVSIAAAGGAAQAATPAATPAKDSTDEGPAATAVGDIREGLPGTNFFAGGDTKSTNGIHVNGASAAAQPAAEGYFAEKPLATPATRKVARELGVDLRTVPPTGPSGRTTKADVQSFHAGGGQLATVSSPKLTKPAPAPAAPSHAPVAIAPPSARGQQRVEDDGELEVRKPFVGMRRKIAQRMQQAKNTAAHFTFVEECDVSELIALRARLKDAAAESDVKLSYLPFIVKAVVAALKKFPTLNSALDETTNELVYRKYYDIGIAAATDAGLMVPVLKSADRLSLLNVAKEIDRLGEGARAGTLKASELSGSTFTITSLGKQGGLFATPVLNHPEVGILGIHQMKQKPVVKNGEIVVGDVMLLSLSFDHRIVDGHVGAAFAYEIIRLLENPDRLLLEG